MDPRVGRGPRTMVAVALILTVSTFTLARVLMPELWAGRWALVLGSLAFNAIYWLALFATRARLLKTRLNRQLASVFGLMVVGQISDRLLGVAIGLEHAQTLTLELLINAMVCGVAAVAVHRRSFGTGAVLLLVATAIGALHPPWVQQYYGLFTGLPMVAVVWLWSGWRSRDA